jgi:glycolate oxidase FAD binding subunit
MLASTIVPKSEDAVASIIAAAAAGGEKLSIEGNGSKRALLRPVQATRTVSLRGLSGITLYHPTELIISARAGTPLPEIEAALAEHGQHIIAEPPDLATLFGSSRPATIGGIVATNLSGPRRIAWGAMRDHVMGIRAVNGKGEVFRSGGRVLKNVTGLDLCKLLTGSHGTLGVITEVTLKVLPAPKASGTVSLRVASLEQGIAALSAGLGSPFSVTGAALLLDETGATAHLRIEDFAESVTYRCGRLRDDMARFGEASVQMETQSLWQGIRDAEPLGATPEEAIWRISVQPSAAPGVVASLRAAGGTKFLLDWGGGLVWVAAHASEAAHQAVVAAALAAQGTFTLFRAPEALRGAVAVLPDELPALAAIARRVKAVMDPAGLLNPGRMRAGQ